jgi:hypothetical protein
MHTGFVFAVLPSDLDDKLNSNIRSLPFSLICFDVSV